MSGKLEDLKDLLEHELQDLYSAEHQLAEALPKMAKSAKSTTLKSAFESHLKQTQTQIGRLEKVAAEIKVDLKGEECKAMKGLIKEGSDMMKEKADDAVHDAGLIAAAQRVEHYEIAGYGTVVRYLQMLKMDKAAKALSQTLEEEKQTDLKLSEVAEKINAAAMA
ncbi:MAG: ferritin-like domain-containing protein [Prolixibacteraceae bacterium]